jgi:hypothetical protein
MLTYFWHVWTAPCVYFLTLANFLSDSMSPSLPLWDGCLLVVAPCSLVEVYRRFIGDCFIALMIEAASTSETAANFYQTTRRSIPEDSHFTCVNVEDTYDVSEKCCIFGIENCRLLILLYREFRTFLRRTFSSRSAFKSNMKFTS